MSSLILARLPEVPESNNEIRESIREIPWLENAGEDVLNSLENHVYYAHLHAREWLFRQGATSRSLYLVIRGNVRLVRATRDGYMATIRCATPGEVLDELCLFSDSCQHSYSAEASGKSTFLVLPAEECRSILSNNPECMAKFAGTITSGFHENIESIATLTRTDAMSRLAAFLLNKLLPLQPDASHQKHLDIPRCWLAAQLAMKPETLSRLLTRLRVSGIIGARGRHLRILDEEGLRNLTLNFD